MRAQTIAIVAGPIGSGFATWVSAAWPERPITFIVPYAAGGANDNSARITAQWLGKVLKQNIIVENRAGANGD